MSEHILVIDDDELVRTGLAANLEREGFQVSTAATGEEGVALALQRHVDLVLSDLVLADTDGIDVIRRIRAHCPETSLVMITGHGSIRNALDALRNGASDYIQKPADPDEVLQRIRAVLDGVRLRTTLSAERQRTDRRKRDAQEQRIRADRLASVGRLAGGVAADLDVAVASVRKAAEVQAAVDPQAPWLQACHTVSSLLQDLKMLGGAGSLPRDPVSMNQLVDRYMKSEEFERIKQHQPKVRTQIELGPMLPPVAGDEVMLARMIAYLVQHAFGAMPAGGMLTVQTVSQHLDRPAGRYTASAPGDFVSVHVSDSGPALSPDDLEHLFEPYYASRVMGRELPGLALTLVQRIVEEHGGFLDVNAQAGQGTSLTVNLPVAVEDGAALELMPDYSGAETILLVDDSEEQRRYAADLLHDLGYRVFTAGTAEEAAKLVESTLQAPGEQIDLLVVDLVLGEPRDGVDVFRQIALIRPGQRAVLASGFADIGRISEGRKLGIRYVLRKPYTLESLGRAVRTVLDGD